MESITIADDLEATVESGCLALSGEVRHDTALLLLKWVKNAGPFDRLLLDELDIADGVAATQAINLVRLLLASRPSLVIQGAPQVLAHNLYRTGLLREGRITLLAMREDEAFG